MKKLIPILLTFALILAAAACSNNQGGNAAPNTPNTTTQQQTAEQPGGTADVTPADTTRTIRVGIWFDEYYDSTHTDIYANPNVSDEVRAQMILDNLRAVEEKYNARLEYINLTWDGTIESINTSIMAGAPDCDIYYADLQFGIPAVLNGYAQALESFLPADSDVLTTQTVLKHLNILDDPNNYLFTREERNAEGYPLGFNLNMIQEANLEDPRDLYDKGEWTWDKWREYLQVLTKDTNSDGVTDVYGYGGYWTNMLDNMLFANNAHIAGDVKEGLSSPATLEVMEFFNTIYNVDKTARPWNSDDWESNLTQPFVDGQLAFFVTKDWIIQDKADSGKALNYELGVVPWPYGPSGNKEGSQKFKTAGNWQIIPIGVKDPEFVFNFYYDYVNWFKGDVDLRDEGGIFDWQADMYLTERNFEMAVENGRINAFDIWSDIGLGDDLSMVPIMNGESTPAQYAEEKKQIVQTRLNDYFGN